MARRGNCMGAAEIAAVFDKTYNGDKNFLTPVVKRYGRKGKYLFEISEGKGIFSERLYGVTVVTTAGEKVDDLSKGGWHSLGAALSYARSLPYERELDQFLRDHRGWITGSKRDEE